MRFITNNQSLSREDAESLLVSPKPRIAVDIEYVSLENTLPLGFGVALSSDLGFYFFNPWDELLKQTIESGDMVLVHNASSDIPILNKLDIGIKRYEDTMLLAYSNGLLEKSLAHLSEYYLDMPYTSVTTQWEGRSKRLRDQGNVAIDHIKMGGWCLQHALNTYALWDRLEHNSLYQDIDRPFIDLVMEMEGWGILVDQYRLTLLEQQEISKAIPLEVELKEELGVDNLNSNPQVADALRERGIIGTRKTKSAKDSVSKESLASLDLPVTNKILKYRSIMKTLTTYVPAFRKVDSNGRLHTSFGYTNTGRLNSSKPNLQNMTRGEKFKEDEEE